MPKGRRYVRKPLLAFGVSMLSCATLSGGTARAAPPPLLPTNLPGVFTFPPPPAGFDPIHSSDEDLLGYGFPPRPNPFHAPRAYSAWARAAGRAKTRIMPRLERTDIRHMPMMRAAASIANSTNATSSNWSGEAVLNNATSFGSTSYYSIWGEFNVPLAQQAFGVCNGGTDYAATWIGIDGYGSDDVLQAGTASDATCISGANVPSYYPWYEWYPNYEIMITNLSISAGDDIDVQVVAFSSTTGAAYLTDETTDRSVTMYFSAPAGVQLAGNSAEWVVERPSVNSTLATLTNYVTDFMVDTVALLNNGTAVWGGTGAPGNPSYAITMLDNAGRPISAPSASAGSYSAELVLHDEGSAR
jgi:hypothetical protein